MGSVPVAQPSPPGRVRASRTLIALAVLAVVAGVGLVLAVTFAWPTGSKVDVGGSLWVSVGREDDFPLWQPVREEVKDQASGVVYRLQVVRLPDQTQAFRARDTQSGCLLPWRPEFEFMGRKGWFRDPCHGATYDLTGVCFSGPCPRNLDRFALRIEAGNVQVNVRQLIEGSPVSGSPAQPVNPPQEVNGR